MKRFVFALCGALYTFRKAWSFYPELQRIRARHREPLPTMPDLEREPGYGIIPTVFGAAYQIPDKERGRWVSGGEA